MVTGFLKLLENKYKSSLDETAVKYIHYAVDGADRMKILIKDLLEYSKVSSSNGLTGNTDMNEIVAEILQVFALKITSQHAIIKVGQLPILANSLKSRLFQLMQNLIGNALKYHGTAAPEISIDAIEKNDHWLFSLSDNGIGIDPVYAEKIFIIFQRLHSKDEFSGTGIGLSICKKIVEMHGGKIWVAPNLPAGSVFYFTIRKTN
jgi:light-regulated signal transduction histidine kinase (bacteriophytochrome)